MQSFLSFPDVVDERAARTVATGVVAMTILAIVTRSPIVVVVLVLGFLARVLSGPRFSPLALLATRVVVPRLPGRPRLVAGTPKRFAQGMGLAFTTVSLGLHLTGHPGAAIVVLAGGLGYYFARDLRKSVGVPIGILNTTWGGSRIETWMSRRAMGLSDSGWSAVVAAEAMNPRRAMSSKRLESRRAFTMASVADELLRTAT